MRKSFVSLVWLRAAPRAAAGLCLVLALALASLGWLARPAACADRATLTVFAAASLSDAFQALGAAYEKDHPGVRVDFNFAGSQQLATQVQQGAGADVFASADTRWMKVLAAAGLVDGAPAVFARNRVVVIVPKSNPGRIGRLQDLARRGEKVVVGAEAVPVGAYTRVMLRKLSRADGFPADFGSRVLANLVSEETNVKQVVAKIQLGEADAGFVYRSDVTPQVSRFVKALDIPDSCNVTAEYPVAVLKDAPHAAAAAEFVRLVLSERGQKVLDSWGFLASAPRP